MNVTLGLEKGAASGGAVNVSASNPVPVVQTGTPALPTGAATAAKQPALGTAGAPSADFISVQGIGYASSAAQTRPNDTNAYTALDVVSDSTSAPTVLTFANVGPANGGKVLITDVSLRIDVAAIPAGMGNFRLHLYSSAPTAINDNAAFSLPSADRDKYLGFVEIPAPLDLGDTLFGDTEAQAWPIRKEVVLVTANAYGILQTVNGFTPTASAAKTVIITTLGL